MTYTATLNEDWIKTLSWDLPTDFKGFVWAIGAGNLDHAGQVQSLRHFMTLPAWAIAPLDLEKQVIAFAGEPIANVSDVRSQLLRYSEDQPRDDNGRFGSGSETSAALTDTEAKSVDLFQGTGYGRINGGARQAGGVDPSTKADIKSIDSAIAKQPGLSNDVTVYRTLSLADQFEVEDFLKATPDGAFFSDHGFCSTSKVESEVTAIGAGTIQMVIDLPKGTVALDTASAGVGPTGEHDLLLPRNSNFTVDSSAVSAVGASMHLTYKAAA